jgi:hypothetical protein
MNSKVGAGYLIDQGTLFLVAADLGISLEPIERISEEEYITKA